jgi:8-oxo-dGTP pyrophosphatase MutT (NUDIX family)
MKTIFFLDKQIHLFTKSPIKNSPQMAIAEINTSDEMYMHYNTLVVNGDFTTVYFINPDIDFLFDLFASLFTVVEAAGGLVKNNAGEYLFIFRNGKWDLPKGKIEHEESIDMAAIREVEEECGISQLTISHALETSFHIYELNGKSILKPTYWFAMQCEDTSALVPQTEEGITAVEWINPNDLDRVLINTFDALREMILTIKKA